MTDPRPIHTPVMPDGIYRPASYVHGMIAGNTLYIAGQVARDAHGKLVGANDAVAQADQVYANLGAVLAEAGASPTDVVKVTTYLIDAADGAAATAARRAFFAEHRPPHTGLIVAALGAPEVRLEVEAIAVLRSA